ncbi:MULTISPECIES: chemotaxis protein CheW [unclassified Polaromonas]|jgi:twitching motility protein PilI|uniref:chemotaxis protein CheW n=1 Tax=unclassified Polaromonas TaxID=2638319 RepID=UPI000F0973DE|nr:MULTISPECIES: chemotaxis protein CheW [unclassified Polaromonas]AYQ27014.1 chemotaxis protein CheW [Polaromonas sp. SP1]QGJ18141.1 chemotaxis protein CheW [Polaromonas sp. Pch-P]
MANRQALRELQTRLADRLQIARTQGVAASWLAVEAGGKKYLFPLSQSGEIFPWVSTQAVPYTQNWFAGVANLRGGLFGVVDLASYVSGKAPPPKNELARTDSRLVALNSALEVNCALLIDKLSGLRNQEAFSDFSEKAPDAPDFFGNQYVDLNGATWQEINLQLLAQQAHFLTIGA